MARWSHHLISLLDSFLLYFLLHMWMYNKKKHWESHSMGISIVFPQSECEGQCYVHAHMCYDPDTSHFFFPHDSLPYTCRDPHDSYWLRTHDSLLTNRSIWHHYWRHYDAHWLMLTHYIRHSWLIPRIWILGSHHMFVQHKHPVLVYKP